MSNLWFFRLKRAEQQRRRSSGEQSVGSASVQSASGCCSAASLPQAAGGDGTNATTGGELTLGCGLGCPPTTNTAPGDRSHRQHHACCHCRRCGLKHDELEARRVCSIDYESDDERDRDTDYQLGGSAATGRAWPEVRQTMPGAVSPPNERPTAQPEVTRPRRQKQQQRKQRISACQAAARSLGENQLRRPQVPQVTIVRPDSTSSSLIAMGEQVVVSPNQWWELSGGESESGRAIVVDKRELVSRLTSETSGLVETNLNETIPARQRRADDGERPPLGRRTITDREDHQDEGHDQGVGQSWSPDASGALRAGSSSSHLLSSGQVPPIRDKSLLDPKSGGGVNLPLADSMDNLAALIPRIRVEFYNSENTLKEKLQLYFIKDHTVSLYVRSAKLILKILACYLYVYRVILDRGPAYANCYGCQPLTPAQANNVTSMPSVLVVGQQAPHQQQVPMSAHGPLQEAPLPTGQFGQQQPSSKFDSHPYDGPINFRALFWVDRGPTVWALQTTIAVICLCEAVLMQYLTYKNNIFSIVTFHFTLELVTNTPFLFSIFWPQLRTLFVPGFLNCWLAKQCLEAMLNDISIVRQTSVFSHRLTILSATVFCLIFTSACGFQHAQRSGGRNFISIFESVYFVVVTFSTVGYGDFKPETWPSQLFIMVMICVALIVLPTQFEQLAYFWIERKKLGASYAHHSTRHEKHVVVCSTTLRADTIMDFLNEFYAHPLLQTFSVVLLSPCELDTTMKLVLQTPTWNNRVVYIQGSALRANDLIRARMQSAEACFILAARNYNDRSAADEHTILRSWAIRDFSPYVPQYVQIFRTENKIHVAFAEHVVCDDEFKYALLANNCLIPGTSTLVTLLLHTSQQQRTSRRKRGRRTRQRTRRCLADLWQATRRPFAWWRNLGEAASTDGVDWRSKINEHGQPADEPLQATKGSQSAEFVGQQASNEDNNQQDDEDDDDDYYGPEWKRLYGKCSANEIYHIRLSDSRFFGEYQGKSFTYASFHSHRKFGVALIGVQTDMRGTWPIMLNPGPTYSLKPSDILFYINITKEENSALMPMIHQQQQQHHQQQQHQNVILGQFDSDPAGQKPLGASAAPVQSVSQTDQLQQPPQSTCIRIEASSPTGPLGQPELVEDGPRVGDVEQQLPVMRTLERHSVADGASIVARSLCSVAGICAASALDGLLPTAPDSPPHSACDSEAKHPFELQSLTTKLLCKRNSSASTSATIMATGTKSASGGGGLSASGGYGSRNASTLELATLASGLRKGSNISITSMRSRDASPTRLKQVVSGLAVKMKRVKLGKSLTHLTIPRMDLGGGSSSSTESFVNARGRRPSIAPVPAMMGESEEQDSDHEREQENYFAMSWQSSSESSPIVKKFVFCTTYVGVSPTLCYLLQRKKPPCCLQLIQACEHCPFKNARQYNWPNRCIILASDFASNGIYNFLVPLRAHFHNPNELRPIVLLLERKPSPQFIDAISWFPMVYWMPGSIDSLDDLIKAGINLAHSVVVTNKESTNSAEEDYLADCNTIVAVQTMFKMFPSVGIITELSQSSNMRFMQFRAHDLLLGGLALANYNQHHAAQDGTNRADGTQSATGNSCSESVQLQNNAIRDRIQLRKLHSQYLNKSKSGGDIHSHAYKYRLPFAAGNVFSASMLDTLLYQAFVKDYMITMVRLLLGIDQAPGSGFLSSMRITRDELWIRTYGRLYQRLCSTTCEIPLGIYRTEPLERNSTSAGPPASKATHKRHQFSLGAFVSQQASYEQATEELEKVEISNMVRNRLQDLGMNVSDYDDSLANRNSTFSYVIINPNCDVQLREGDIIYLIRPSPIHSRKLFMHRANSVRYVDHSQHQPQSQPVCEPVQQHPSQRQHEEPPTRGCAPPHHADQPVCHHHHQQPAQDPTLLKSYFSDGDFSEVLIRVNDHDDLASSKQALGLAAEEQQRADKRRRSSCSDAGDSKRSSLSRD